MPKSLDAQAEPRARFIWNGDVWKAIVEIRQQVNLDTFTCEMDEGIAVIRKLKNSSILKIDKPINKLKFKDYYYNYKEYLRTINLSELKEIL